MRFFFFLLVSLIVHVLILANINEYKIKQTDRKQVLYDVTVVTKAPEEPMPEIEPETVPMPEPEPMPIPEPKKTLEPIKKLEQAVSRATRGGRSLASTVKTGPDRLPPRPMTAPSINLPQSTAPKNYTIAMPKLNSSKVPQAGVQSADRALVSQLDSQGANYRKGVVDISGAENLGDNPSRSVQAQNFFVIKSSGGNRKLVHVPEKPEFSLTTGTTVRASFKVERDGSTSSIILLNRTDSKIERLAIDFIQKLKFNAALTDQPEPAEIILYFRVK